MQHIPEVGLTVIKVGTCTIDPGNTASLLLVGLKQAIGIGGGSSVSLINNANDIVLVDTGFERESDSSEENENHNWQILTAQLKLYGVLPEQVNKVFITHFHRDHFGCLERFNKAKWYCHTQALSKSPAYLRSRFIPLEDGAEVTSGTVIWHTPGHNSGHSSLIWTGKDMKVRVAICGDAILNLAWQRSGYIWQFNQDFDNIVDARSSAAFLIDNADIIIPGHGQPFFSQAAQARK